MFCLLSLQILYLPKKTIAALPSARPKTKRFNGSNHLEFNFYIISPLIGPSRYIRDSVANALRTYPAPGRSIIYSDRRCNLPAILYGVAFATASILKSLQCALISQDRTVRALYVGGHLSTERPQLAASETCFCSHRIAHRGSTQTRKLKTESHSASPVT
jgi:hypothetical protein